MFRHTVSRHKHLIGSGLMLVFLLLPMTVLAQDAGGAGDAFGGLYDTIKSLLTGSLGKLLTVLTLAVALVIAVKMQSVMGILVAVAVAICAVYGPAALETFFTAGAVTSVLPARILRNREVAQATEDADREAWRDECPGSAAAS